MSNPTRPSHILGRIAMRRLTPLWKFVFVIMCLPAMASSITEACCPEGRCRVPFWACWIYPPDHDRTNTVCWCCSNNNGWEVKGTDPLCTRCDAITNSTSTQPSMDCIPKDKRCTDCTDGSQCCTRYYAMVCDKCTHCLRFARPRECHNQWYPLCCLGAPCTCKCSD